MSYSVLANPPSPYSDLQQPPKSQASKLTSLKIAKFHALLCAEAIKLSEFTAVMESYKRFQRQTTGLIWYFTQISKLDGAVKRPQLPAKNDATTLWAKSWQGLSSVARQVICDLGAQDAQKVILENNDVRDKLLAGLSQWPKNLFATGQGAETALSGWTCSVFVGEALCQAVRQLKLPDELFLTEEKQNNRIVHKFIGAQSIRKFGLFENVLSIDIEPGHIASLSDGHHVEIVTRLENDKKNFCSIGAGRPNVDNIGKILCGSDDLWFDQRREINNSSSVFLQLKPDHKVTKRVLGSIKM